MEFSLILLVVLIGVGGAWVLSGRKPSTSKRSVVHSDKGTMSRKVSFVIKKVEVGRRPSLDWDGSEDTREESMEDVYIVTADYGRDGDMSTSRLWVGDGVEVILQADILLSTLGDADE